MASKNTTIAAEIQINTKYSGKTLKDLRTDLKGLKDDLENAEFGSQEFNRLNKEIDELQGHLNGTTKAAAGSVKELKELKKQLKETAAGSDEFKRLSAQIRDVEDGLENAKAGANDFAGALENADGPVGMLGKGIRQLEIATSSWGAALKASGIGLLVALVAGLAAAFAKNEEAMKKLEPIMTQFGRILNGILGAMQPIIDGFIDLATKALPYVADAFRVAYSALSSFLQGIGMVGSAVKKFISGDFAGAWDDAKKSVTEFGTRYEQANKGFIAGAKELTDTEKAELDKRAADRKAAKEKRDAEEKAAKEKRDAEEKARLEKAKADAKAYEDFDTALQQRLIEIDDERKEKAKKRAEELLEAQKTFDKFYNDQLVKIKELDQTREDTTFATNIAIQQSWANLGTSIANTIGYLSGALKDGSDLAKAFGIAQVAISTAASIGSILLSGKQQQAEYNKAIAAGNATIGIGIANAFIPGMQGLAAGQILSGKAAVGSAIAGKAISKTNTAAQVIAAGVAGAAQIAAILASKKSVSSGSVGGGGDSNNNVSISPSAPLMPSASTTTLNQAQVNQMGNMAARAYVVESDISGNQERITRLNRAARIS
jgi:hypothetical protein